MVILCSAEKKTAIQKAMAPLTPIRKAQTGAKLQTQFFVPLLFFAKRLQLLRTKKGRAERSPCKYGRRRMKNSAGEQPRHKCVFLFKTFFNPCGAAVFVQKRLTKPPKTDII